MSAFPPYFAALGTAMFFVFLAGLLVLAKVGPPFHFPEEVERGDEWRYK